MKIKGLIILVSRLIYSISWFFLSPIISSLLHKYNLPIYYSSLVPISFFIGSAIMQVPAALLSTKIGMKITYSLGLIIMGITDTLIAFANSFSEIILLYGLTGVGSGLFFSSSGGTLASLYPKKSATVMGVYNALYGIGGAIGLEWGLVDKIMGFFYSTLLLGLLTLVLGIINMLSNYTNYKPDIKLALNKNVILIALGTAGAWGEFYAISELYPSFANFVLGKSSIIYGVITSVLLYSTVIGGFMSFIMDIFKKHRIPGLVVTTLLGIIPALTLYTNYFIAGMAVLGFFNQISISLAYALAVETVGVENSSLALGELNALQIGIGTLIVFISSLNLALSWYTSVIISLLFMIFIIPFVRLSSKRQL
ncbi:MAG: MFS transporter [Sulfolobus sp.]|nr:MFS transporter [Sulfolobus sp.]